jgi:hypothetical protein
MGWLKSIDKMRLECAKLGLEPIKIKTRNQVLNIKRYVEDIGVYTQDLAIIPLGFDYGCI